MGPLLLLWAAKERACPRIGPHLELASPWMQEGRRPPRSGDSRATAIAGVATAASRATATTTVVLAAMTVVLVIAAGCCSRAARVGVAAGRRYSTGVAGWTTRGSRGAWCRGDESRGH
ncbi:hypothetical protein E2562_024509 [Oryza meyeriana var. granulata]|uniref:Uncharacterized protein n=1 Tax=Oryza meyeriana var. granulata TaxID=110450 RepID=A0A6G1BNU6_9ORYZ|nr:hypothetical protein E2562_024509 [Oryza meyeriana var. granulata]